MNISIISFSARGYELSENLAHTLSNTNGKDKYHVTWERCRPGKLHNWTVENFSNDALIFIGSCGIAVRAIAPLVKSKVSDPAVIVMDERGKYCISLLSGHIGGANRLVRILAELTGAEPVITTATDLNNLFSVDEWASSQGMKIINPGNIVKTADKILNGETIFLKSLVPVGGPVPPNVEYYYSKPFSTDYMEKKDEAKGSVKEDPDVLVSWKTCPGKNILHIVPPVLVMGVGCQKGTSEMKIQEAFYKACIKENIQPEALSMVCSIDLKKEEAGLINFCSSHGLNLTCYSSQDLSKVHGNFPSSEFVSEITGVDNVCQRSAALACGSSRRIIMEKTVIDGITLSFGIKPMEFSFNYQ